MSKKTYLLFVLIFFVSELTYGWGSTGHKIINRRAVWNLPQSMATFKADSLIYEARASDADIRRNYTDTSLFAERWRHYFDIDDYPNFHNLPRDLNVLVSIYGLKRVRENGTNPWAVVWFLDSLTAQLSRNDISKVRQTASDIGHYIADGFQPLHCTINYDGQLTGNNGIHSRYESTMLNTYQSQIVTYVSDISYIHSPIDYVFDYIIYSNSLVDSILQADNYAKAVSGWNGSGTAPTTYYSALWDKTKNLTINAFQRATVALASFWYTAWVNAGKLQILPNPSNINFAKLIIGSSSTDSILITNTTAELLILNAQNPDTQNFRVSPLSASVPKNSSVKFYITFKPEIVGTFSSTINFIHNLQIPPINLQVSGSSYARTITLNRTSINFPDVFVGDKHLDSVTIYNTSGVFLTLKIHNPDTNNFKVFPDSLNIPVDSTKKLYILFKPEVAGEYNFELSINNNFNNEPVVINISANAHLFSIDLEVKPDWNLISIPVKTFQSTVVSLFQNSLMDYFYSYSEIGYNKNYQLSCGKGYWAKFNTNEIIMLSGIRLDSDTIDIQAGWNIIGSISRNISIQNIQAVPPDLTVSNFYGYDSGYYIADSIKSGLAYWVKSNKAGKLILSINLNVINQLNIDKQPVNPPPPPGEVEELIVDYNLYQNHPNPFNPVTEISYDVSTPAQVQLKIYDVLGKEIATLVDEYQYSGRKKVLFDAKSLSSGIYFYKLTVNGGRNYSSMKKMVLIK